MADEVSILATLKGSKGNVQSEFMDEATAQQELDRIMGELNDGKGPQFIKLGKSATVNRDEVLSVEVHRPPKFI